MRRYLNRVLVRVNGWPRRVLAACCLLAAVASALHRPAATRTATGVPVVVAAHDLSIGTTLAAPDLRVARWPPALAPPRAYSTPRSAVGRRLSTPTAAGEPITSTRVIGSELTAGIGVDQVASTVVTASDLSMLVHPGDRVDLLAAPVDDTTSAPATGTAASVVARDAQVLAVLAHTESDTGSGSTLIVATSRSSALVLAAVTGSRILAVVGRSP